MPQTPDLQNRSRRMEMVSRLVRAYVQACAARAYVAICKEAPAFADYGRLSHPAMDYAEKATKVEWEVFAPLVHIRRDELISAKSEVHPVRLIKLGEASLAYALCLKAQIDLLPAEVGYPRVKVNLVERPAQQKTKPISWPSCRAENEKREGVTQDEIVDAHIAATGFALGKE